MCVYYNTLSDDDCDYYYDGDDDDDDNILDIQSRIVLLYRLERNKSEFRKVRVLISSPLNTRSEILRVTFAKRRTKK
jgi:hypothetical protein